jgi:hypothetical protein
VERVRNLAALLGAIAIFLPASAHGDGTALHGVVTATSIDLLGPDGRTITHLDPGTYSVDADDRSNADDFVLRGPGVSQHTEILDTGRAGPWTVTLRNGWYHVYSSSHEAPPSDGNLHLDFSVGSPPPATLHGVVTDTSIALTDASGAPVTHVDPGTYSIDVDDRSATRNFRLAGPGVEEHTQNHVARRITWTVTLADGVYSYFAESVRAELHGCFTVGTGAGPAASTQLVGYVGPDFAIALESADGSPVARPSPGSYTITVHDTSNFHNFHLTGPGVDRQTALPFVGDATWQVTLRRGLYFFVCDPHRVIMSGAFSVTSGGRTPPPPPRTIRASVGAGGRIALAPRSVRAGTYALAVRDGSRHEDVHVVGPGVNRRTGLAFTGSVRWHVRLRAGGYRVFSDAHRSRGGASLRVR